MLILLQFATLFHIPSLFVLKTNWNTPFSYNLLLRVQADFPYLLARNALNDLRNQRIASGGYTDAADAALANLLRAKVPFHLFGHMR